VNIPWQALWALQPWLLLVATSTPKRAAGARLRPLVTGRNVEHALRRLVAARSLVEHQQRLNSRSFVKPSSGEAGRRRVQACGDALRYFVDYLVPAFRQRDWDDEDDLCRLEVGSR